MSEEISVFETLKNINVNDKTKSKNVAGVKQTFLSWVYAWGEIKKLYPDATYEIKKFGEKNLPYVYDEKTGYMVFTSVTINNQTHEMWLPVMDHNNKAMKSEPYTYENRSHVEKVVEPATMFDINKALMRCFTKNLGMFGLGLYIYAGEDVPENEKTKSKVASKSNKDGSNSSNKFITLAQKDELKAKLGGAEFAKVMNEHNGKLSEELFKELMEK